MNRRTRPTVIGLIIALAVGLFPIASPQAIERRPLPAFTVTTPDGRQVESPSLVLIGKWLLVYVQPRCPVCDTLLGSIDVQAQPDLASRMVIVVAGVDAAGVAAQAARFPALVGARWFADPDRSSVRLLKLPGTPVVFGLRLDALEWSLVGVMRDAAATESALVSWAGTNP